MSKAIAERTRPLKPRSKCDIVPAGVMSLHSVSLLLEAILLKAKSLEELSRIKGKAISSYAIWLYYRFSNKVLLDENILSYLNSTGHYRFCTTWCLINAMLIAFSESAF